MSVPPITPFTPFKPFTPIKPHVKDLGGFTVKRLLPSSIAPMVGPFIFFDHMGPATFAEGQGIDVRPHPHIGLATVTYLFDGTIDHRDSLGTIQPIRAGDVNWMTAGRGIAHSERTPAALRTGGNTLHGIQTWVALPLEHENTAPAFEHHPAATLPVVTLPGVRLRVIAGTAYGRTAPPNTFSDLFYVAAEMDAGASLPVSADHQERAVYAVDGTIAIDGEPLADGFMALLEPGKEIRIDAASKSRVMLLGGAPLEGERFIWWNFVSSSRQAIERAKEQWRTAQFGSVPGETEWIPLPPEPKPPESFS
ncbi:MAG: putative YhhW family protein [Herminiimonas sp.]|nr:putative YhhW family protein [Herminiimonas sp.]